MQKWHQLKHTKALRAALHSKELEVTLHQSVRFREFSVGTKNLSACKCLCPFKLLVPAGLKCWGSGICTVFAEAGEV